jgi:aminoglycoside phosphotransferase (APT) family kinase protein
MSPHLPNAERDWDRPAHLASADRGEIERCIGPTTEPLEILGGGLANANVRVGDRVVRLYRRDPQAAGKEAALLRRRWSTFRVPSLLAAGEDFLVLEYVSHTALGDGAEQGRVVGRALAEIHRSAFPEAGLLGPDLTIATPLGEVTAALGSYALGQLDGAAPEVKTELRPLYEAFLARHGRTLARLASVSILLHGDFKASNLHWTAEDRLLVLDWEFAYAGPALMDVGQLLRWMPSAAFVEAFGGGYRDEGGVLPDEWPTWAAAFDLFNLAGLLGAAAPGSRRARDVIGRVRQTVAALG